MMVRGARRGLALAVGGVAAAMLLAGCGGEVKPPKEAETIPPGPDVSPPSVAPDTPSAAPSVRVDAKSGCITPAQLMDALIYADPDAPPSAQTKVTKGPVCDAGWAYAAVAAPDAEGASVVLRHTAGRWQVLTYGSAPCVEPRVSDAPKKVKAAAGC